MKAARGQADLDLPAGRACTLGTLADMLAGSGQQSRSPLTVRGLLGATRVLILLGSTRTFLTLRGFSSCCIVQPTVLSEVCHGCI
jgi:hypothetical protein